MQMNKTGQTNFINCKEVENPEQRMHKQLRKRQVIEMHKHTKLEIDTKLEKGRCTNKKDCSKNISYLNRQVEISMKKIRVDMIKNSSVCTVQTPDKK